MCTSRLPSEQESRIERWRRLIFRQQLAAIPLGEFCRRMGINTRRFSRLVQRPEIRAPLLGLSPILSIASIVLIAAFRKSWKECATA